VLSWHLLTLIAFKVPALLPASSSLAMLGSGMKLHLPDSAWVTATLISADALWLMHNSGRGMDSCDSRHPLPPLVLYGRRSDAMLDCSGCPLARDWSWTWYASDGVQ